MNAGKGDDPLRSDLAGTRAFPTEIPADRMYLKRLVIMLYNTFPCDILKGTTATSTLCLKNWACLWECQKSGLHALNPLALLIRLNCYLDPFPRCPYLHSTPKICSCLPTWDSLWGHMGCSCYNSCAPSLPFVCAFNIEELLSEMPITPSEITKMCQRCRPQKRLPGYSEYLRAWWYSRRLLHFPNPHQVNAQITLRQSEYLRPLLESIFFRWTRVRPREIHRLASFEISHSSPSQFPTFQRQSSNLSCARVCLYI